MSQAPFQYTWQFNLGTSRLFDGHYISVEAVQVIAECFIEPPKARPE